MMVHFLDIPHPMSERSPSQTNFVIEEDGSDYGDMNSTNNNDNTSRDSSSFFSLFWSKTIITLLTLISIALSIALTVFIFLYYSTLPSHEICRTKSCTRTSTLFIRTMDESVDPCEDFQKFACGNWITDTATVVSVSTYDHTTIMRDRIVGRLRGITENISISDIEALHQLKYMYNSCVDLETIEKAGLRPMLNLIKNTINTNSSVSKTLGKIRRQTGQSYIISLDISVDYLNTSYNSIFLDRPELPVDKDILLDSTSNIVQSYEFLIQSVTTILAKEFAEDFPLFQDMVDNVNTIIEYDTQLAESMTDEEERTKSKMNNIMTIRQLNLLFSGQDAFGIHNRSSLNLPANKFKPLLSDIENEDGAIERTKNTTQDITHHLHFNWTEYFETVFHGILTIDENTTVVVNDLGYIRALAKFMDTTNRHDIDMYLTWQLIFTLGKDVTDEVRSLFTRFSGKLQGDESTPNRRTACISLLDKTLPFLLTHKYVQKYVNHSTIEEAEEMADNIIKAFKGMVSKLDWMDANTKSRAILKADHVRKFLGYPSWLTSSEAVQEYYKGLKFTNSFFNNMVALLKWTSEKSLKTISHPVDSSWASMTDSPAEADAFYDDEYNAISFPAGFLQEPFIGMGLRAADYGALGAVVGHELTHGFDTEGRFSDENGRLNSWWSVDTLQRFIQKAQCFVDQYNNYRLPELATRLGENNTVNGRRTLAENIADNGGIREAFEAYKFYIEDKGSPEGRLPGLEKYSPEQIFFISFAQSWCSYMNPTSLADLILTNEHSPSRFRIIGPLSNFDEFSRVWSCKVGSTMNPVKKCVLW